jgi:hypothetical protein
MLEWGKRRSPMHDKHRALDFDKSLQLLDLAPTTQAVVADVACDNVRSRATSIVGRPKVFSRRRVNSSGIAHLNSVVSGAPRCVVSGRLFALIEFIDYRRSPRTSIPNR